MTTTFLRQPQGLFNLQTVPQWNTCFCLFIEKEDKGDGLFCYHLERFVAEGLWVSQKARTAIYLTSRKRLQHFRKESSALPHGYAGLKMKEQHSRFNLGIIPGVQARSNERLMQLSILEESILMLL